MVHLKYILTSNGLTSDGIIEEFYHLHNTGLSTVAIIVTADHIYKEKSWLALDAKESFEKIGFKTSFIDIDHFDSDLQTYDIIYFIGGNPFYLANALIKNEEALKLKEYCREKYKVISGASAGAIVLGTSLELIHEFDPQLNNEVGVTSFSGLNLYPLDICPHYSRFVNKYNNFENRIQQIENKFSLNIIRLNDGEALVYEDYEIKKHIKVQGHNQTL